MATVNLNLGTNTGGLKRSLRFRDLVLFGVILIQPTAPMPVFGVIYKESRGHVVAAILLAMLAMLCTSVSYGRMARVYPQGGSAFLYVSKEVSPVFGYIAGWCLTMDYILNPLICTIWCSRAAMNFFSGVPYVAFVLFFALLFTALNCNGVETSARINTGIGTALGIVILLVVAFTLRWIWRQGGADAIPYLQPFYDHASFKASSLLRGTSIAVLTYIGFDGISTLTDEAKDPERSVPRAIVLTCLITGILASVEVYAAQLVWPRTLQFPDVDTAYVHVCGRMGGPALFAIVNGALLFATIGSGMASQLGAGRLLYAMGKDGALPGRFFAALHPKSRIPRNNVLLVGAICLVGAMNLSYQLGTELLNYGALLAFIGVNIASILHGWRHGRMMQWFPMLLSLIGLSTCLLLWVNLGRIAWMVGTAWAIVGLSLWGLRRFFTTYPGGVS
jgi:amino acid transporter